MQRGTGWIWGVFRHSDSEVWMCVPGPTFSVYSTITILFLLSPLQQPPDQGPHSLTTHYLPHRSRSPKNINEITLTPYLTWPQGPSWSDWASSLSTLRSTSLSHPHHFLWLAQFPPTAWDVCPSQGWFITQISGKYHFCREDTPHPPV